MADMQPGTFDRTFSTERTRWIVEGFSQEINRLVYPHIGWSWTSWTTEVTDTFDNFARAQRAISCGYLKDMIETQKVVDIHIYEVMTTREIVEKKVVKSYAHTGDELTTQRPQLPGELRDLTMNDFLILEGGLYCRVDSISTNHLFLSVVNGGWKLVLDLPDFTISKRSDIKTRIGEKVIFRHLGTPDPSEDADEYNLQMAFYEEHYANEHFADQPLTSTLVLPS